jgi:hypothetical protein
MMMKAEVTAKTAVSLKKTQLNKILLNCLCKEG